jgi:hypothetical protein
MPKGEKPNNNKGKGKPKRNIIQVTNTELELEAEPIAPDAIVDWGHGGVSDNHYGRSDNWSN